MQVTLQMHEDVALIRMDDGKKNAITLDALAALNACVDEAETSAGAIVLAGRPGSFCAGFDIRVMTGDDRAALNALSGGGARFALRLYSLGMPLVAACTGHAFTIGAIWLATCDTRIGERGAFQFGMVETAMGMTLPDWALEPLQARLRNSHWLAAIAQSEIYAPDAALEAGFIDSLVDTGQAIDAALLKAAELAALPGKAYAGNKMARRGDALRRMEASLPVV
ncbi:MAG: crotonase/enoyl-CoA hydratase family protein [Pseudomonadota bacterium]